MLTTSPGARRPELEGPPNPCQAWAEAGCSACCRGLCQETSVSIPVGSWTSWDLLSRLHTQPWVFRRTIAHPGRNSTIVHPGRNSAIIHPVRNSAHCPPREELSPSSIQGGTQPIVHPVGNSAHRPPSGLHNTVRALWPPRKSQVVKQKERTRVGIRV